MLCSAAVATLTKREAISLLRFKVSLQRGVPVGIQYELQGRGGREEGCVFHCCCYCRLLTINTQPKQIMRSLVSPSAGKCVASVCGLHALCRVARGFCVRQGLLLLLFKYAKNAYFSSTTANPDIRFTPHPCKFGACQALTPRSIPRKRAAAPANDSSTRYPGTSAGLK